MHITSCRVGALNVQTKMLLKITHTLLHGRQMRGAKCDRAPAPAYTQTDTYTAVEGLTVVGQRGWKIGIVCLANGKETKQPKTAICLTISPRIDIQGWKNVNAPPNECMYCDSDVCTCT